MQRKYRKFPQKCTHLQRRVCRGKCASFLHANPSVRKTGFLEILHWSKVVFVLDLFTDETLENSSCRIERNRSQGDEKQASVSTSLSLESWDRFLTGSPEWFHVTVISKTRSRPRVVARIRLGWIPRNESSPTRALQLFVSCSESNTTRRVIFASMRTEVRLGNLVLLF